MVLDKIPGKQIFTQRDVRETSGITTIPTIGDFTNAQHTHSDAATGGITTHAAGDGSDHADVATNTAAIAAINASNVTSNVAGAGIDVSSATGDVTISCEDSTAGNKGIIIVAPGEGIDVSYASGTATIEGEDATTTNKGIARFNSTDFDVAGGEVTIDDAATVRTVVAGEGIDVSSASGNPTISGENATTTNKGIASFNTNDFTVSSGAVSLKNKTSYYSFKGIDFVPDNPPDWDYYYDFQEGSIDITTVAGDNTILMSVHLPHGAVVTRCIVSGSDAGNTWYLYRDNDADLMATAAINTADTSISNATIDNQNHNYFIQVTTGNGDYMTGGTISYTTDYI